MNLLGDRMQYISIFGVNVLNVDFKETIDIVNNFLKNIIWFL